MLSFFSIQPAAPEHGRVRRFSRGGRVRLLDDDTPRVVEGWHCDPAWGDEKLGGGSGNNAKYLVSGIPGWTYDWQLRPVRRSFQEFLQCLLIRLLS